MVETVEDFAPKKTEYLAPGRIYIEKDLNLQYLNLKIIAISRDFLVV
jgi:hypothetical protein